MAAKKPAVDSQPEDEGATEREVRDTDPLGLLSKLDEGADMIDRLFDRHAPANSLSKSPIRQRELTFTLAGEACTPGFLEDEDGVPIDVRITMRTVDSGGELEALKKVSTPGEVAHQLAYAFLYKLNGRVLSEDQKAFLWEGVGIAGRHIMVTAYHRIGGAGESAMGKFLKSFTIS